MKIFRAALFAFLGLVAAGVSAEDEEPLNAAGPVGVSSGHSEGLRAIVVGTSALVTGGVILAVLLNNGGNGTTATTGTTGTAGTTGSTGTSAQ